MLYQVAEKFKSLQGEGLYTGTPMAFIRFVGCSVGKKICHACDTDFERMHSFRGGGEFTEDQLLAWAGDFLHICLTGGEPLDQDLEPLMKLAPLGRMFHIETSGTKPILHLRDFADTWICVSPKPGYEEGIVESADEVKIIVPGLGNGPGWPTLADALRWVDLGKEVFLQPRNGRFDVDPVMLKIVQDCVMNHPNLRLSVQMHKILKVQ